MKIDFYSKTILTIIALSLLKIAFTKNDFIDSATAQPSNVQKITICDVGGYRCAGVDNNGHLKINWIYRVIADNSIKFCLKKYPKIFTFYLTRNLWIWIKVTKIQVKNVVARFDLKLNHFRLRKSVWKY